MKRNWTALFAALAISGFLAGGGLAQQSEPGGQDSTKPSDVDVQYQPNDEQLDIYADDRIDFRRDEQSSSPSRRSNASEGRQQERIDIDIDFDRPNGARVDERRTERRSNQYQDRFTERSSGEDQTWSQWWSNAWQDAQDVSDPQNFAERSARRLIGWYDQNNDQEISQRELPQILRRDFDQIDRNGDSALTTRELAQHGLRFQERSASRTGRQTDREYARNERDSGQSWEQWWSSWFESGSQQGQSSEDQLAAGVRELIRQHDRNDDGYLSRGEVPQRMQQEFFYVDIDDDGYLDRNELSDHGKALVDIDRAARDQYASRSYQPESGRRSGQDDEQTWSQWWNEWWQKQEESRSAEQHAQRGAEALLGWYDRNNDDHLSQRELPQILRRDFERIDRNRDDYLSSNELERFGDNFRQDEQYTRSERSTQRSSQRSMQRPVEVAYIWVLRANEGRLEQQDLQEAYDTLRRLDRDNNGEISEEEMRQGRRRAASQWADEVIERLDQNSDGELSRNETERSNISRNFERVDQNGDGSISSDELREAAEGSEPSGEDSSFTSERNR